MKSCEDCGNDSVELTRHHLTYTNPGDPDHGSLADLRWHVDQPDNIVMLCWPCHQARHRDNPCDEYWRDCEEMKNYFFTYYEEMARD